MGDAIDMIPEQSHADLIAACIVRAEVERLTAERDEAREELARVDERGGHQGRSGRGDGRVSTPLTQETGS